MAETSPNQGSKNVMLGQHVQLFPSRPLPEMDRPPIKAYEAVHKHVESTQCFALVCDMAFLPRITEVERVMHMNCDSMFKLMEYGVTFWPPTGREEFVLVYKQRRNIKRLVPAENGLALRQSPSLMLNKIIPVFVRALSALEKEKLPHGTIKLSNIYAQYDGERIADIIIGDMLALPYGYDQAPLYKTTPMMLANPAYCGVGTLADDIYAVGVCIAQMLRRNDPMANKTAEEIWNSKTMVGSYGTLLEQERFGSAHLELLRGVLQDHADKRWTIEEMSLWQDGRKLSPKQYVRPKPAPRPMEFNGKKYIYVDLISKDLALNPAQAVDLEASGVLSHWIERSVGDKNKAENLREQVKSVKRNIKGHMRNEVIAATMALALSPQNPIFFKSLSFYPTSLGAMIWSHLKSNADLSTLMEVVKSGLISAWVNVQTHELSSFNSVTKEVELCENLLRSNKRGYGMERCLYALLKRAPCQSPTLRNYYVQDGRDLLLALDDAIGKGKTSGRWELLIDRHICAFLAERNAKAIEGKLFDLDNGEDSQALLAALWIYADLQTRYKLKGDQVKNIARVLNNGLDIYYQKFKNLEKRVELKKRVGKLAEKGDLSSMYTMLTDMGMLNQDKRDFNAAWSEYHALENERQEIKEKLIDRKKFNQTFGREISAVISSILAAVILLLVMSSFFVKG